MPLGVKVEKVGESSISYNAEHLIYIRDYYFYCVNLFRVSIIKSGCQANFIFGDYEVAFGDKKKKFRIDVQYEHTLVKQGGRDAEGAVKGRVMASDGSLYLVRIANFDHYLSMDGVIEYSMPNIENIRRAGGYEKYLDKCLYISPLLYPVEPAVLKNVRSKGIITTFNNENEPRRKAFLSHARSLGISISNEKNRFDHASIGDLYADTRILVNIRQTQHHHTFEELRVLPALLCGCLVISEDVPLREMIPYKDFIIWADMESIVDVIREVDSNYNFYFNKIFSNEFFSTIDAMRSQNENSVNEMLASLI